MTARLTASPDSRGLALWTVCLAAAAAAVAAFATPTAFGEQAGQADAVVPTEANLQPGFEAGMESRYEMWMRSELRNDVTFNGQEQSQEAAIEMEGEVDWVVERVEGDGGATCRLTVDWLAVEATGPDGQTRRNDTRQGRGDDEQLHMLLRAITGESLRVRMTADGRVDDIDGLDAIRRRMGEAIPGAEEAADAFIDFRELAATLATIPGAPAGAEPGTQWQGERSRRVEPGRLDMDLDYELVGTESIADIPIATVSVEGRGELEVDRELLEQAGPGVSIDLDDLSHDGQIIFDLQRGEVVGRHSNTGYTMQTRREGEVTLTMRQQVNQQSQLLRISETDAQ